VFIAQNRIHFKIRKQNGFSRVTCLSYPKLGVKRNFWPLRNFWPVIVPQVFCFSEWRNEVWR